MFCFNDWFGECSTFGDVAWRHTLPPFVQLVRVTLSESVVIQVLVGGLVWTLSGSGEPSYRGSECRNPCGFVLQVKASCEAVSCHPCWVEYSNARGVSLVEFTNPPLSTTMVSEVDSSELIFGLEGY